MLSDALVDHINDGGTVAYPTSTLPGLACLPRPDALDRLFALKQRSADKPVSLGVLSLEQAEELVRVPEKIRRLESAFPKGGFTFILDAYPRLTDGWEATAWPFDVLLIQRPGNWSKRLDPSRPRAPMSPVKHLPQPPKKQGLV